MPLHSLPKYVMCEKNLWKLLANLVFLWYTHILGGVGKVGQEKDK